MKTIHSKLTKKTNCSNTLVKFFYKPEEESVTKLSFFDADNSNKHSFYNLQKNDHFRKKSNNSVNSSVLKITNKTSSKFF